MADPKFANLPGIAYDQPDLYETPDVPENDTAEYYEEEQPNDSIERLHISTKDSAQKFQGKNLVGNVDFSDSIIKRHRKGYDAWTNEYALVGEGEKETPIQKCRRIQCEINELLDEITALQNDKHVSKDEQESFEAVVTVINTSKKVLDSLRLEQILGKEELALEADQEFKSLVEKIDEYKKSGILTETKLPPMSLAESTRIAQLEYELHNLEQLVGAKPETIARLSSTFGTTNLIDIVQQLTTKAAMLQPNQIDLIEARLGNVLTKLDTVKEKTAATNHDVQFDQKILELYDIAKETEPIIHVLPDIIERMQSLESLHKYATNFTKIIADLEGTQNLITNGIAHNKMLLQGVQSGLADNMETINKEVKRLEQRMDAIKK
ncbi:dynactin subunit 2 [Condylostylus longicornis]|uniref:dynactin subunit 2 n=1 Tax=Condylostylus longicornis TaxID=2530218 RepID=UPI00244DB09F|nr:dynactin subunit 2 [Condylostylus longicornis]